MPETEEIGPGHTARSSSSSTNEAVSTGATSDLSDDQNRRPEYMTTSVDDAPSIPYPFESDEENGSVGGGGVRKKSISTVVRNALHLSKRYPDGYESGRINQIIRSLNQYPAGYGKIAAVEDLDSDFSIYRKFGFLHHYALLYLQDELAEIQDDLERLDRWEFSDGQPRNLISRRRDHTSHDSRRKELVDKLHSKLTRYDEALLRLKQIQAIKRPSVRAQRNLYKMISNTQSLVTDESDWIREGPDLAALGSTYEHGWLNTFLEDMLGMISRRFTMAVFSSSEQRQKTGNEELNLLSKYRFDVLLRIVLTIIAAVLLLVPVFILFRLQPSSKDEFRRKSNYQILTVFLFTLAFSASCSIFTKAKRQEVFTATAAYSAVLVVFLGNTSNVMVAQHSN